ncbi:contactin-associated protein-like 2 isoform X1 [Alosa alosa]|nr:contactin-associated protein-like 2 isoform X1 [Alosa alosa]XP_048090244.1 contactin-associated protein-like 2 isoform X1 [Alosa alosa]
MASTTFDDLITSSLPSPIYHTFFPPMDDDETTLPSEDVFTTMLPGNITHPPLYEESTAQMESTSTIYNIIGGHYIEDHTSSGIILIGVILATVLVFLCIVLVLRYTFKHKGSYHTNEKVNSEAAELRSDDSFKDYLDEDV